MPESKHTAIYETLRKEILGGKYLSGKTFPSERSLMKRFAVSRTTIRSALQRLQHLDRAGGEEWWRRGALLSELAV